MMAVRLVLLRTYYFIFCLFIASGSIVLSSNPKDFEQRSNNNSTKDTINSTTSEVKDAQNVNLKTVTRSRRSNLNSNLNGQFNLNAGENAAFNSAFRYNDQIMRNLLKTHSPNHARSHFFLNLITPLDRRATRYNSWDDHSVMHFGKRSVSEEEGGDNLTEEKSQYEFDPNSPEEGEIPKENEDLQSVKRGSDSWTDHNVLHFGKRDGEVLNGEEDSSTEIIDEEKKSEEAWHNMMNFGKKSEDFWNDHNTLHFGKRDDPWHSMMSFGKRSENLWNDHNTMHFGKREDPWHSMMSFGKKSGNPWIDHNTMHFGKRDDPWHNIMSFGKKSGNSWNDHNTMHFGKKDDPWHSMMSFGKRSENPWNDHNTMHFGKREDPWHSMMSFGKKSEDLWNNHNTMHFGKKNDPWHSMMSFGKKSENPWNDHNTMHFGKRDDPWHSMMSFGKRSESPWNDHNTLHFGKKEDPWHSMMSFGKKSLTNQNENNKNTYSTTEDNANDKSENYESEKSNLGGLKSMSKRSADSLESEKELKLLRSAKNQLETPVNANFLIADNKFNEKDETDFEVPEQFNYNHENFEKKSNPWESHNTMHFGKKSDPWDSHNTMHFGKKSQPWDLHNTMHFGKKSQPWDSHNTMHFGKRRDPTLEDISAKLKQTSENTSEENKNDISKLKPPVQSKGINVVHTEKKVLVKKRSVEGMMSDTKNFDNEEDIAHESSDILNVNSQDDFPSSVLQFGQRPFDDDAINEGHFMSKDVLYLTALEQKRDPWDSHNTLHFGKRFDPWDSHNTLHFGKRFDPWDSHNTMHFGKKSDPWSYHNTMHFGKRADPWQSHNTMHFGKRSDPWQLHNTMHFGKKFDPWQSHNTMHFGKKSDPWQSHNTMHFGKKSDPWENHNTLHFGKRDPDQLTDYIDFSNDPTSELNLHDPASLSSVSPHLSKNIKDNYLTSLENESNLLGKLLQSRINNDSPEDIDQGAEDLLFKLLENTEKLSKSDTSAASDTESDSSEPMPRLLDHENVPNQQRSSQTLEKRPEKRYLVPFQGPKSIVYPHAWLVSQIRRSVPPNRQFDFRVAEKKEDPINSYMHFGRR